MSLLGFFVMFLVTMAGMLYIMLHDGEPRDGYAIKNPTMLELCRDTSVDLEHRNPDLWGQYCIPLAKHVKQFEQWEATGTYDK